jgi:hypothetical protein
MSENLNPQEEYGFGVFENSMLRAMFVPKREKPTG